MKKFLDNRVRPKSVSWLTVEIVAKSDPRLAATAHPPSPVSLRSRGRKLLTKRLASAVNLSI